MTYKNMAYLYDQLMSHTPYEKWLDFTIAIFKQEKNNIHRVADLGCGTGELTTRLKALGYDMYGVDISSDMLTYAEQKSRKKQQIIQWLHQDIRHFKGLENLDAIISYVDVMNYITTEEDLSTTFHHIYHSLKDEGLFIFDVHSLSHVEKNLINQTFADVTDDMSYIWFCFEGEEQGEMFHDLTFFTLENDTYHRFEEYHHQRTFSVALYEQLLMEAGFEKPKVYSDFSLNLDNPDVDAQRIFFVTRKRTR